MNNEHAEILGKPISVDDIFAITEHAGKLANIIREWLPVAGDSVAKTSDPRTAADFFSLAAKEYENCELVRNPDYVPFGGRGLVMERGFSSGVFSDAAPYWQDLLVSLDELAILYHWEGISDHSGAHGWNWWGEDPIPSADPHTLDRMDKIASALKGVATEIMRSEAKGIALAVPSSIETENEGKSVPVQDWKKRRETLNETVEDQMTVLYKKDQRTAAMTSPEIAAILECSEPAVRKATSSPSGS